MVRTRPRFGPDDWWKVLAAADAVLVTRGFVRLRKALAARDLKDDVLDVKGVVGWYRRIGDLWQQVSVGVGMDDDGALELTSRAEIRESADDIVHPNGYLLGGQALASSSWEAGFPTPESTETRLHDDVLPWLDAVSTRQGIVDHWLATPDDRLSLPEVAQWAEHALAWQMTDAAVSILRKAREHVLRVTPDLWEPLFGAVAERAGFRED
jgi:hypothetical protein